MPIFLSLLIFFLIYLYDFFTQYDSSPIGEYFCWKYFLPCYWFLFLKKSEKFYILPSKISSIFLFYFFHCFYLRKLFFAPLLSQHAILCFLNLLWFDVFTFNCLNHQELILMYRVTLFVLKRMHGREIHSSLGLRDSLLVFLLFLVLCQCFFFTWGQPFSSQHFWCLWSVLDGKEHAFFSFFSFSPEGSVKCPTQTSPGPHLWGEGQVSFERYSVGPLP